MHLTIESVLKKSIRSREYWLAKTTTQTILQHAKKYPCWQNLIIEKLFQVALGKCSPFPTRERENCYEGAIM